MAIRPDKIRFTALLFVMATMISAGFPSLVSKPVVGSLPNRNSDDTSLTLASASNLRLPMIFEVNRGQADDDVRFMGRGAGFGILLKSNEAVLSLNGPAESTPIADSTSECGGGFPSQLRMRMESSNENPFISGENPQETRANYYIGRDRSKWITDVETYSRVSYSSVYPGINLTFYGNPQQLEYDFTVAAGANPGDIKLRFEGANEVSLDDDGALTLRSSAGTVTHNRPFAYQEINGSRVEVPAEFRRIDDGGIVFDLGSYDQTLPLVIDPVLVYSTYLGGSAADTGRGIIVNSIAESFIAGDSFSSNFLRNATPTNSDVFLGKVSINGLLLTYTFFGGSKNDTAAGLSVDAFGNLYLAGTTESADFPIAHSVGQSMLGDSDAFVVKLTPTGDQFIYSSLIGGSGSETGVGIAGDAAGNAYITGRTSSQDFPIVGPIQAVYGGGDSDAFVAKIVPDGNIFSYSTLLGGSEAENNDGKTGIAVDSAGVAYVVGDTQSSNFPTKNALRSTKSGSASSSDGFVAKINATGTDFVYSTYLGGNDDDFAHAVAADNSGNAYVTGRTKSTSFTGSSATRPSSSASDAFVTKLNSAGSALTYLTFIGGVAGEDTGNAIVVDSGGIAVIAGSAGDGLNTVNATQSFSRGGEDALVARLGPAGTVIFSTYLGGSNADAALAVGVDPAGVIHITGYTDSTDLPTVSPLVKTNSGQRDILIARIDPLASIDRPLLIQAVISGKHLIIYGQNFQLGAVLRVNDEPVKTRNDEPNPIQVLFAKKAAKRIGAGETVQLQVENPDGKRSNLLFFTKPQ
jgi:Beta-propeller repeat